ncbi:hypothetical protein H1R16_08800 [Marnyiella aurantia]|uniref:Lipoprotein n=1 Tax=Marnyiella aurantia TaxID=2758037 RepID=A0A7D7LP36_9FLAO|nr:hypothetical protein [Marnyiella aurantia]MBA5246839.1 hypothetical protein [Marnyiella aurantia]QMS97816.1 hypothetical protein H1R16_08800 [Marnyiella aurantia]
MKNLSYIIFSLFLVFGITSCSEVDDDMFYYKGDAMLNFNKGTLIDESVLIDTDYKDIKLSYGTIEAVTGSHTVNLVFDASKSTAVEGVDFIIQQGTDGLVDGEVGGTFSIRLLEPAIGVNKTAVFTLQSSTMKFADFDQVLTLSWKLQCTVDSFLGGGFFLADPGLFTGTWPQEIVEGPTPNTLILKDYIETGFDIVLSYDASGNVTFEPQQTGFINGADGMISIKMATDGTPSKFDACNRILTLRANYFVTAGTFGNVTDLFTGM